MERTSVQKTGLRRVMSMTLTLALSVGTLAALPVQPAQAAPQAITMQVVSARDEPLAFDGAGVSAGDTVTAYPSNSSWSWSVSRWSSVQWWRSG
jgi:plastocyanin